MFPNDMVCLRNISVDTLRKGDTEDDDDDNNNLLLLLSSSSSSSSFLGISFTQGIYTYISETNHVPREHCVAAILM